MRKAILLAFMASFALAITDAAAHGYTGTLGGIVLDGNGRPAPGAEVIIERSDGSAPVASRTDSNGRFLFKFVLAGYYDIRASRGSMATPWKHNVIVHPGKETAIDLRLKPIRSNSGK